MADVTALRADIAALDRLELATDRRTGRASRLWACTWPKLAALGIVLAGWQAVVATGWRPTFVLPGPATVGSTLWRLVRTSEFWQGVSVTMTRAAEGFAVAVVVGTFLGVAVARWRPLRTAVGSLITALQTMPSIAWFPLAILLFQLSESAILFVVVLGAAPAIANGLIAGIDFVPPLLVRAGRSMGANGLRLYRYVVLPASLPSYVAGLKHGWALAWRSLMAGELLVVIAHRPSIGARLQFARDFNDSAELMAWMVVILVVGLLADAALGRLNTVLRRRWGLLDAH